MNNSTAHIRISQLEKSYRLDTNEISVLQKLSCEFHRGEFVALCGTSGSGKTTMLNLLGGLDSASAGEVWIGDLCLSRMNAQELDRFRAEQLGFVFQTFNLLPVLTAVENVEYPLLKFKLGAGERRRRALEALASVGLQSQAFHRPAQLSGGQRQRVALARAFVHRPQLIIADEPTANLDRKTAAEVLNVLSQLNQNSGITVIVATHDPTVMAKARRCLHMYDGVLSHTALAVEKALEVNVHPTGPLNQTKVA